MAERDPDSSHPLDVEKIHQLVRLMKRYDLTDLHIRDGEVKIRLRRRGPEPRGASASTLGPFPASASASAPGPASAVAASTQPSSSPPPEPPSEAKAIVIKSPMVGTYYSSNAPDAPPFVTVGSVIHAETTVCIIEAMKVFTDIPAGVSGTVAEVMVKNGQPVEFDQPLFRVIPA